MPRENTRSDSYEALMWDIVTNAHNYLPKVGHRVLDLGAHFGMFSLYCASRGCAVVAYEPTPDSFHELQHTAEVAQEIGRGWIETHNEAVWTFTGEMLWRKHQITSASNRIALPSDVLEEDRAYSRISCVSLESVLAPKVWDCVKVDIEGAEYEVFTSLPLYCFAKIQFLSIEIHNDLLSTTQCDRLRNLFGATFPFVERLAVKRGGHDTGRDSALFCWR
jgi:FkbM family methyltransferase